MGLFSLFSKNKQQAPSEQSAYQSRAEEDSSTVRASRKRKTPDNQAADPVLPEKKRARRRLVGAVALVLAVVIILPMVLDSEPKPLSNDIKIAIPSRDLPAAAVSAASSASSTSTPPPISGASNVSNIGNANGLDKQEEIVDPSKIAATPASVIVAAPLLDKAKNSTTNVTPSATTIIATQPVAPEKPKLVEKPKPKASPVKVERKVEAPKVEIKSTKPILSAEQEDAARAAAILNGHPYNANAAASSKASAPPTEKKTGKLSVPVAALKSQDKVNELQSKLNGAGIRSYTQKVKTSSGELTRIIAGPFATQEEADKARAKLSQLGLK